MGVVVGYPEEMLPLLKLRWQVSKMKKERRKEPHWAFCYDMLWKVSRSFALVIQNLQHQQLRDAVCVFYLVERALDTIGLLYDPAILQAWSFSGSLEDDTSIPDDVKVPTLQSFYLHIDDHEWHFPCGRLEYKVLMDNFDYIRAAFLDLDKSYQKAIVETSKTMGAGMAKFICKEVVTVDDFDEYCYYVAGVVAAGLYDPFIVAGAKNLPSDRVVVSAGIFLQKTNVIRDYLEDINELPKPRKFWPQEIWSKYAEKLEDFKKKEFSEKALQCLNELVTNALPHAVDSLEMLFGAQDPIIFRSLAIPQVMAIGTLALCYNNDEVFKKAVKMRRGTVAKIFYATKTITDVYSAFFEFSRMLKSKIDWKDPSAAPTSTQVEALQNTCIDSGLLKRPVAKLCSF